MAAAQKTWKRQLKTRLSRNGNEAKTFSRATTGEQRGRLFMLPPW
jgi:hypothetical protein